MGMDFWAGIRILYFLLLHLCSHSLSSSSLEHEKFPHSYQTLGFMKGLQWAGIWFLLFQAPFFIHRATDEHSCSLLGSITAPWLSCSLLEDSKWQRFPYPAQRSREAESGGQSGPTLTSQQLKNSLQDHWWRQQASLNLTYLLFLYFLEDLALYTPQLVCFGGGLLPFGKNSR